MHITLLFAFISPYLSRYYLEFKSARQQANGNASFHCHFSLLEVSLCSKASLDTAIWINKVKLAVLRAASALYYYSGHKKSARTEAEAGSSKGAMSLSKHQHIWLGEEQTLLCQEAGRWKAFWCDPRKLYCAKEKKLLILLAHHSESVHGYGRLAQLVTFFLALNYSHTCIPKGQGLFQFLLQVGWFHPVTITLAGWVLAKILNLVQIAKPPCFPILYNRSHKWNLELSCIYRKYSLLWEEDMPIYVFFKELQITFWFGGRIWNEFLWMLFLLRG